MEEKRRKRIALGKGDKIFLVILAAIAVATILVNVMRWAGFTLIKGEFYMLLPVMVVAGGVGWGIFLLIRKIRSTTVRAIVNIATSIVLVLIAMVGFYYLTFIISLTTPQQYAKVQSKDGKHSLVVLRRIDVDEARIATRKAARLAAAEPGTPDEEAIEDYGYIYTAYAPALGLFYKEDSLIEGECIIGYSSTAELMVDWEEDGTVGYFYVQNPAPADGGECRAKAS